MCSLCAQYSTYLRSPSWVSYTPVYKGETQAPDHLLRVTPHIKRVRELKFHPDLFDSKAYVPFLLHQIASYSGSKIKSTLSSALMHVLL